MLSASCPTLRENDDWRRRPTRQTDLKTNRATRAGGFFCWVARLSQPAPHHVHPHRTHFPVAGGTRIGPDELADGSDQLEEGINDPPTVFSNGEVGVFGLHGFGGRQQHPGADGGVGALFNQYERAGEPAGVVAVMDNRFGGFQAHDADVVYRLQMV